MKILIINVVCGIRSTGRLCTSLAATYEKQGNEVRIAYGRETVPKAFRKYAFRIDTDLDVIVHVIKARLFDACGWGSKRATRNFIEWIKEFDPDVIHLHNIHGYYINIELLFNYLRICGKKIIWTLHDCWAFTGHTAYCDAYLCDKWKTECGKCPGIRDYPASIPDRSKTNFGKKKTLFTGIPNMQIVSPSIWLKNLAEQSFLNEYPIRIIHNGIETNIFHHTQSNFKNRHGITEKKVLLGVATAWNEMKGLSDYFALARELDDTYRVVLVGLTERQIKKLPDSIIGLKRTNNPDELAEIYSDAEALIVLSKVENYPTTILEAISCGTPVVSYDVGAVKEMIGTNGIVVHKGDIAAVVDAVKKIDRGIVVEMQEADIERMNMEYLSIIESEG